MNYFVFTTGCYSDYAIHEIYAREEVLAKGEVREIIRVVAARIKNDRAWARFREIGGLTQNDNTPERDELDELREELANRCFLVVPFNEIHLYDYDWGDDEEEA